MGRGGIHASLFLVYTGQVKKLHKGGEKLMNCPKCNGTMEINHIRTHLVWVDELDHVPDPG